MKFIQILILVMLCMFPYPKSEAIPLTGVVEGFYGTPWTTEQRIEMVHFIASKGMNAYIYAPKDDPYHREKWREPYPMRKRIELEMLNEEAEKVGVQLIFAISPGLDIDFYGANKQADREAMVKKMQLMYDKGFRQFALFFDDIPEKDAIGQAAFINYIDNVFIKEHKDIKPLIVVPTEYFLTDMRQGNRPTSYTATMAGHTNKDVIFLYTGEGCCPDGLSAANLREGKRYYVNNPLGIWWNYPVNDYMKENLALGPLDKMTRDTSSIPAFFVNPMEKMQLSKIAIATAADYVKDPANYDENDSWLNALQEQYGNLAMDMMLFAEDNQRLENSWAHIGRENAKNRKKLYDRLELMESRSNSTEEKKELAGMLIEDTEARLEAYERLEEKLPEKVLKECSTELKTGIVQYKTELIKLQQRKNSY